jgi:hypothetical protein
VIAVLRKPKKYAEVSDLGYKLFFLFSLPIHEEITNFALLHNSWVGQAGKYMEESNQEAQPIICEYKGKPILRILTGARDFAGTHDAVAGPILSSSACPACTEGCP